MTEDLKFIVAETNKLLKTDYNLISFDSLSVESLLQLLIDVLCKFDATTKIDVKDTDPVDTNKHILEALKRIQYRPEKSNPNDPNAFRRNLVEGSRKTVYPILQFIYKNTEKIKYLTYLAQYLIPINLPPEALAIPEIAGLWSEYQLIMDQFKEAHKMYTKAKKDNEQFRELRSDIGIMETEKDNVKKRIELTQGRLDKIPQQELLLEAAHALRIERDRQKELQNQLDDQKQGLQRASMQQDRLHKELSIATSATHDTSPQFLLESILEETQVLDFMVKQKLPQEIATKQSEINILEETINQPNISREYLKDLQDQVEKVSKDVQKIVENQLTERGANSENLMPFRQQAATVARNKEMAAEQLDQSTRELREIEQQIRHKQELLQETVGGVILRGDELKQYVNMLRAKSSVYKQQRSELATLKAESTDLQQTLENLKQQDQSLNLSFLKDEQVTSNDGSLGNEISVESHGITELARVVDGLTRAVVAVRERAMPLSQQIAPLRLKVSELKEQCDEKKQIYNALKATLNAESAVAQNDVTDSNKSVKKLETTWQDLKTEYNRIELLLKKANDEQANKLDGGRQPSLKETLLEQIAEQEELATSLDEEFRLTKSDAGNGEKQHAMWADLNTLLKVKLQCHRDIKQAGNGGTLVVNKGAETFTLQ